MAGLDALAMVNPYLSRRRVFILTQLANTLANTTMTLASNDPGTQLRFWDWTGQTQEGLEADWSSEKQGFTKAANGTWTRPDTMRGAPATTSCEGLIGTVMTKIEQGGFGKRRGGATSFNLAGLKKGVEQKPAPAGWNWYNRTYTEEPQPGDLYSVGILSGMDKAGMTLWQVLHVGVITRWDENGDSPKWETVEAGQGGPSRGYDFMKRNEYRLVFPVRKTEPRAELMGWLDIDEHFG